MINVRKNEKYKLDNSKTFELYTQIFYLIIR